MLINPNNPLLLISDGELIITKMLEKNMMNIKKILEKEFLKTLPDGCPNIMKKKYPNL